MIFSGLVFVGGCNNEGRGFALPKGDIDAGKFAFSSLRCNDCHSIGEIKWIGNDDDPHVQLGGEVSRIKTYGELVTSVINPSHKISKKNKIFTEGESEESMMMNYNEIITVQELIDIVTFLQSKYEIEVSAHYYQPQ